MSAPTARHGRVLVVAAALAVVLAGIGAYRRAVPSSGNGPRVLVIGIDGATWNVLDPMLEDKRLPNLARLIERGVHGRIRTLNGQLSPVIWTGAATGKSRRKHGIRGFTYYDPEAGGAAFYTSGMRESRAVWEILSGHGIATGVFNWMVTHPAERLHRGFVVSDRFSSGRETEGVVFPEDLKELLPAGGVPADRPGTRNERFLAVQDYQLACDTTTSLLLQRRHPGLPVYLVYTAVLDRLQHNFWKYMRPEEFDRRYWEIRPGDIERYGEVIEKAFEDIDRWVGELVSGAGEDTVVMVLSDHGFAGIEKPFYPLSFAKILDAAGLGDAVTVCQETDGSDIVFLGGTAAFPHDRLVRFVESIRTSRGERLYDVREAGRKGFDIAVWPTPAAALRADDTVTVDDVPYPALRLALVEDLFFHSGEHDYDDGVFIAAGPHIRKGLTMNDASVLDIAPTILYLKGLPVAADMDGGVITRMFEPDYLVSHPVRFIPSYEDGKKAPKRPDKRSDGYRKRKLEELRSLGYITGG